MVDVIIMERIGIDHDKRLRKVLDLFKKINLKINRSKEQYAQGEVDFCEPK